ncbi:MAG: hypothetical protein KA120_01235 [Candidatus Goldbacteria bacterium]|nr:hypothetical protein [Candidatus Goldiibacteriota bacterium]
MTTKLKFKELKKYLVELFFLDDLNENENNFIAKNFPGQKNKKEKILIEGNLKKVVNIASKYRTHELNMEDLIEEGNKGLIYSVINWNPNLNDNFTNYVLWNIEGYILNFVIKKEKELEKK